MIMTKTILKSLVRKGEQSVDTYKDIFKFEISCEGISRMISYFIDGGENKYAK
jgi:hypothetical protein